MLEALMGGEHDVEAMADMALTRMRPQIVELRLALEGRFDGHHGLMLRPHLDHIDQLSGTIEAIDAEVDRRLDPFAEQSRRLQTIREIGKRTAAVVISEVGVDMSRFPTAGHLASWAGLCPGNHESAGKRRSGKARKGNAALRTALCEAAWSAARTKNTYLSVQFRRFCCHRFGKKGEAKAIFAVAHTMIGIIWHVLHDESDYIELGPDWFDKHNDSESPRPLPRAPTRETRPPRHPATRSLTPTKQDCGATPRPCRTPEQWPSTSNFRLRSEHAAEETPAARICRQRGAGTCGGGH